jgi:putative flippase GtrA
MNQPHLRDSSPPGYRLFQKFWRYTTIGISTYALDLVLIFLFREYLDFPDPLAIGLSFFIAVTINFWFSYHWVFRGTTRSKRSGYLFFSTLAVIGLVVIVPSTLLVQSVLTIDIYYARTIVAICVGIVAFLINTFFNFKMLH